MRESSRQAAKQTRTGWGRTEESPPCRAAARVPQARTAAHTCSLLPHPTQNQLFISAFLFYLWPWGYRQTAHSCSCNYTFPYYRLLQYKHPSVAPRRFGAWTITDDSAQLRSTASSYDFWVQVALLTPTKGHHERRWGSHQPVSLKTKKRKDTYVVL